jgi:hypothetical protein
MSDRKIVWGVGIFFMMGILVLGFVSAGLFGWGDDDPNLAPFEATVTVDNEAPFVASVTTRVNELGGDINPGQVDPVAGTTVAAVIYFIAEDSNGDSLTADAQYQGPLGTNRPVSPVSCVEQVTCAGCNGNQVNFSCTTTLQYYDEPSDVTDNWNVVLVVDDGTDSSECSLAVTSGCGPGVDVVEGGSEPLTDSDLEFVYSELKALVINSNCPPDATCSAAWNGISLTSTNQEADDALRLLNRGNILLDDMDLAAFDLVGATTPAEAIPSEAFSISSQTGADAECDIVAPASAFQVPAEGNPAVPVGAITQPAYGLSIDYGDGVGGNDAEDAYFCIWQQLSPTYSLSAQDYQAIGGDQWTLVVGS